MEICFHDGDNCKLHASQIDRYSAVFFREVSGFGRLQTGHRSLMNMTKTRSMVGCQSIAYVDLDSG
jgi:acetyl-CoA carboxylase beta subunit